MSDDTDTELRLRSISGSLRYAFRVSDSLLLKIYGVVFVGVGAFVTVLWLLTMVTWLGRLSGVAPVSEIWGFLPFLVFVYLVVMGVLILPLYIPMRRYRETSS
ncbi:hypothetical protein ACEU6E_01170 [Halorutilales archaeon Cl-col2-1]